MSLKYAILSMLVESEKSGYDLNKHFEKSIGYYWSASHQQIYKTLGNLLADELVSLSLTEQSGKPDKKLYTLTTGGREALKVWALASVKPSPTKNQLLIKVLLARLVGPEPIIEQLNVRLKEVYAEVAHYAKIEKQYFTPKPGPDTHLKNTTQYLTLRHGVLCAHAELDWLHEAIDTLQGQF